MRKWISSKKKGNPDWWQEHAQAKILVLRENAQEAFQLLKKQRREEPFHHKSAPWFLVIGSEDAGKTTLLSKSGLELAAPNGQPLSYTGPTAYCDWWLSKKAVFIDTSGGLIIPKKPSNDAHFIWKQFLELLHEHRKSAPADGIILCVDLYDFHSKSHEAQQTQIDVFRHRIQTLRKYRSSIPLYLVFTKCDHISGFMDSYSTFGPEEANQIFGLSLPNTISTQNLSPTLNSKFDELLEKINQQLLGQLHREHRLEKRAVIKNFPLQIESQKREIIHLASQLHSQKTSLKGIYFTSALQDGQTHDILTAQSHQFGLPVSPKHENFHTPTNQRSFFIRNLLKKFIKESLIKRPEQTQKSTATNTKLYAVCASFFLLLGIYITSSYLYQKNAVSQIQLALTKEKNNTRDESAPEVLLSKLATLKYAISVAEQRQNPAMSVVFRQNSKLTTQLQQSYNHALQTEFTPLIVSIFENKLSRANTLKAQELFEALKAYLMLNNPSHLNPKFLSQWFSGYWKTTYSTQPETQKKLLESLNDWVNTKPQNFHINQETLNAARKTLNSFSLSELAYLTLSEKYDTKETTLPAGDFFSIQNPGANNLYASENLRAIYENEIPTIAQQIIKGDNWVLDIKLPANLTGPLSEQLVGDFRQLYLQRYADFWQAQLFNAKVNNFANIKEAYIFTSTFSSNQSPVIQLLSVIEEKLRPLQEFPEASEIMTLQNQIHIVLINALKDESIAATLNNLQQYLAVFNKTENIGDAVLKASQKRMENSNGDAIAQVFQKASSLPQPLNKWLEALASNTWKTMLDTSQNQLNLIWITEVVPKYNETVKDRFPIFKTAKKEMSLSTFAEFFGPDGIMQAFFQNNLAAFTDTQELYWKWKTVDGQKIDISQDTLEMINLANLIKQMFFNQNQKEPILQFALMPNTTGDSNTSYLLNLHGNYIDSARDAKRSINLMWPIANAESAWFEVNKDQQRERLFEETGAWSLFKLLTYANIKTTQTTKVHDFIFNAHGKSISYTITAEDNINPFIPDLLTEFRCPKEL